MSGKTIAIIATAPVAVKMNLGVIIESLKEKYSVIVMTNLSDSKDEFLDSLPTGVELFNTKMKREIKIFHDLRTLFLIYFFLKSKNIEMVLTITPKGGFIGNLGAFFARVKLRIHIFTGQVWITKKGFLKFLLKLLDKLTYIISSKALVDSKSQRDFLIEEKVIKSNNSLVLGKGSLCGVDIEQFSPNLRSRKFIREKYKISSKEIVFLLVGRLNKDKGIIELLDAFSKIKKEVRNTSLWLLGPLEIDLENLRTKIDKNISDSVHFFSYSPNPELYMASADIFCLPSHREGFGTVIIESAACGLPAIGSNIYGLRDSILDGITGFLVDKNNSDELEKAMLKLLKDSKLRSRMGEEAKKRAEKYFNQVNVVERLINFLDKEINTESRK